MRFCPTNRLSTQERPTHQHHAVTRAEQESGETADLSRTPVLRVRPLETRQRNRDEHFSPMT